MILVTYKELAPSHWAPYLINNDDSGLESYEVRQCLDWLTRLGYSTPVSCEDYGIGRFKFGSEWLQCDLQEYTFCQNEKVEQ